MSPEVHLQIEIIFLEENKTADGRFYNHPLFDMA
jgi:hypothetical protein